MIANEETREISINDFDVKIKKELIFRSSSTSAKKLDLLDEYDYNNFNSLGDFDDFSIYKIINDRFGEKHYLKESQAEYILKSKMSAVKLLINFRKACESNDTDAIINLIEDLNSNHEELRGVINDMCITMYQLAYDEGLISSDNASAKNFFENFLKKNNLKQPENLMIHAMYATPDRESLKTLNECISAMKLAIANPNKGVFVTCDISQQIAIDYLSEIGLSPANNSNIGSGGQTNFDIAIINWTTKTYRFYDIKFINLNQLAGRYANSFILHFGRFQHKDKVDSLKEFIKNNAYVDLNYFLENFNSDEKEYIVTELLHVIASEGSYQTDLMHSENAYLLHDDF